MIQYASKSVANAGLTTGIIGTALGVLGNGNGLGGILGGGNSNAISTLQAENAMLKAENYSDKVGKEVYSQTLTDNRNLRTEHDSQIAALNAEANNNRVEIAKLQAEIKCNAEKADLREQIVLGKINEVALVTKGRFDALDQTIAGLSGTVNEITKTVIPNTSICPGWGPICTQPIPCPKAAASKSFEG